MSMEIKVWDVKHGSATSIITPNGHLIFYDLGASKSPNGGIAFSPIMQIKKKYPYRKQIDWLIISHPDEDHITDFWNVNLSGDPNWDGLEIGMFSHPSRVNNDVREKMNDMPIEQQRLFKRYIRCCNWDLEIDWNRNIRNPSVNGGIIFERFFPKPDIQMNRINNHSIVLVLTYLGVKILLSGDNERASWIWLLENKPDFIEAIKETDIFLASHHGRESGYCEEIFDYFTPKLTLISDTSVGSTSITEKYHDESDGMYINGNYDDKRYVLTTRYDGRIKIIVNSNGMDVSTYLG